MKKIFQTLSGAYHLFFGFGPCCRFTPSCSEYADEAWVRHGGVRGSRLVVGRLLKCHPWGASGWDPVPQVDKG